ncbi:FctA domain-containing protein [Ruminococcus sp.]|uniref:Spy0128 family protein n=1 Tax=Ruminococcus sp. TaxID=41978 RepID=UPI0025DAA2A9|nr:FctA domain-containing protein [Ruminococcus sp.]MBQ8966614.1 hypothetical protein [Ruminococcus sp.]
MKSLNRISAFLLAAGVALNAASMSIFAEGIELKTEIPFRVTGKGSSEADGVYFTVKIEAEGSAPMPEVTEIKVEEAGEYKFPPITFTEPGNYCYTLSEICSNEEIGTADPTIYEVTVAVFSEEDGRVWGSTTVNPAGQTDKRDVVDFESDFELIPPEDSEEPDDDSDSSEDIKEPDDSSLPEDSSGDDTSLSSQESSSSSRADSSSKAESSSKPDSSTATLLDTLLPPNTGGRIAVSVGGALIPLAAIYFFSLRRRNEPEEDDGGEG